MNNLNQIITFREEIAATVLRTFKLACDPWGVTVERVEVNLFIKGVVTFFRLKYLDCSDIQVSKTRYMQKQRFAKIYVFLHEMIYTYTKYT